MQNNFWNGKKKKYTSERRCILVYSTVYKIKEKVPDEDLVFSIELVQNKIMIIDVYMQTGGTQNT